ncbi:MAG TPA: DNA primase [Candidatus Cloacimonadota bacterium]|jgi:DNA primase|nr:DNA primase [Candidatus Cloacimonadota bacterium]HOG30749.1 DNA primase [Candidatus Cloacimonadota bacterium]HOR59023.1 DNA primase [Candidatus Cloacimonadota bacterium]HPB08677.1 DNA primase [Candidatus Cloacimonadota bacterium]HPL23067.1 DNA primase [Candidatus Cloacimonadota bacterium]
MEKSLIEQIRHSNDIVDVVQGYLPLKHVGANWRGICPFHNDTNPSLYVSQPKQIFKCFACGKAGNVFTFVQEYEKLTFIEAVKKLAARVGIAIPEFERTKTVSTKRDQLLVIYRSARDFFASSLFEHGSSVLKYLAGRSFSEETAKALELGYALNSEKALLNHLLKEGHSVSLLKESGLFGNYSGNLVDFFRNRLMFPIHNNIGEVIAFGGRVWNDADTGVKYVNSSGTELYTKGKELYGLFKTKYEITKAGYALICEGYFDFLRLYEAGFMNSVASLGTALTEDQIFLLSRYAKRIYMLYDGDKAGVSNAIRAALICLGKGLEANIVELPPEHDPDSFILDEGGPALRKRIASAQPITTFLARKDWDSPESERIDMLLEAARGVKDAVQRELLVKGISEAFSVSTAALFSKLGQIGRQASARTEERAPILESPSEERWLLTLALRDRESFNFVAEELTPDYFINSINRELYKYLLSESSDADFEEPAALLDNMENKELRDLLAELLFSDLQDMSLKTLVDQVRVRKIQRDLEDIDRRILAEPGNFDLLRSKMELLNTYRNMINGLSPINFIKNN